MKAITCVEADEKRTGLTPLSSITNWVGGEVLNHNLPPLTAATWGNADGTEVMREELDADGCRHYLIEDEDD